jgi:hypothetical protein
MIVARNGQIVRAYFYVSYGFLAGAPACPASRPTGTANCDQAIAAPEPVPLCLLSPITSPDPRAPSSFGMAVTTPPKVWGRCDNHPIAEAAELLIPDASIATRTGHDHGPPGMSQREVMAKRYITGWHHAAGWPRCRTTAPGAPSTPPAGATPARSDDPDQRQTPGN